jgi:hypothetical protein
MHYCIPISEVTSDNIPIRNRTIFTLYSVFVTSTLWSVFVSGRLWLHTSIRILSAPNPNPRKIGLQTWFQFYIQQYPLRFHQLIRAYQIWGSSFWARSMIWWINPACFPSWATSQYWQTKKTKSYRCPFPYSPTLLVHSNAMRIIGNFTNRLGGKPITSSYKHTKTTDVHHQT